MNAGSSEAPLSVGKASCTQSVHTPTSPYRHSSARQPAAPSRPRTSTARPSGCQHTSPHSPRCAQSSSVLRGRSRGVKRCRTTSAAPPAPRLLTTRAGLIGAVQAVILIVAHQRLQDALPLVAPHHASWAGGYDTHSSCQEGRAMPGGHWRSCGSQTHGEVPQSAYSLPECLPTS